MALVSTALLLGKAYADGGAVTVIEVATLEQAEAAVLGAEQAGQPVILQVGPAGARFRVGGLEGFGAALGALGRFSLVDVSLHLDHVTSWDVVRRAATSGFSSVMLAVEHLDNDPWIYTDYARFVTTAVEIGHEDGLVMSVEVGCTDDETYLQSPHLTSVTTDVATAAGLVGWTGVDALTVSVGDRGDLDLDLVARLRAAVGVPLLLPDASDVPQPRIADAVAAGLSAVAFARTPNLAFTQAIRRHLHDLPDLSDPTQYLAPARQAMGAVVAELVATVGLTSLP